LTVAAVDASAIADLTVAFTDLEDFTAYTVAEGDDAASRLLIGHHRQSEPIVRRHGGRVVKRLGDGLMLAFPAAAAAVLACLELRDAAPLRLRAGIHGGNVLVISDDVIGQVVNLAARVTQSAGSGELIVTDHVRTVAGDMRGISFDGPHLRRFKGIEGQVRVYAASGQGGCK
jgi:adenylate cyclase